MSAYATSAHRRRRRTRVNWDRFGRVALVLVLFAVLVSYLNPVVNFIHAWHDSKASKVKLDQLARENAELRSRVDQDSSDAVMVREARKLGMVRPGERAYVVHNLPH
jgi:cell division protein FtsB